MVILHPAASFIRIGLRRNISLYQRVIQHTWGSANICRQANESAPRTAFRNLNFCPLLVPRILEDRP